MIVATRFSKIQTRDTTRVEQQGSFHLKVNSLKKAQGVDFQVIFLYTASCARHKDYKRDRQLRLKPAFRELSFSGNRRYILTF